MIARAPPIEIDSNPERPSLVRVNGPELRDHVKSGEICDGLDLSGADLSGLDLGGGIFSKCKLRGASLRGTRLKESVFSDCDLDGAQLFTGESLLGVQLGGLRVGPRRHEARGEAGHG